MNLKTSDPVPFSEDSCVWLVFSDKDHDLPLGDFVQTVDWSMRGALSRFRRQRKASDQPTYLPTMGRLPSPMIIVQETSDSEQLGPALAAIEQLGFSTAILWIEEEGLRRRSEKFFMKHDSSTIQQLVSVES